MATVRLRRVFRYPEDSDGEHDREELDEEEQERVIKQLQSLNSKRNAGYSIIFTAIPLISAAAFIPSILSESPTLYERLLCFLALLSSATTAYIMKNLPLRPLDNKGKRPVIEAGRTRPDQHLITVNAIVCTLLALAYFFSKAMGAYNVRPALYVVPGAMLMAILIARRVMLSVDPTSLEDLRYEYKGA
ncbi:hypothetical protein MAP00_006931 [Monascus purpureus]|nr:hypothetical protein MAP00_006931 [Monascus purpureus]